MVTIISLFEQIQGRFATLNRAKNEAEAAHAFHRLLQTVEYFRLLTILAYDAATVSYFERLRQQKIRIGTQDLRIAAIELSHQATVVTRNLRDFGQVPGLRIVDWSQPG